MSRMERNVTITQITIKRPNAEELTRIINAQKGDPRRMITCIHQCPNGSLLYQVLDRNYYEKLLQEISKFDPSTKPSMEIIVHELPQDKSQEIPTQPPNHHIKDAVILEAYTIIKPNAHNAKMILEAQSSQPNRRIHVQWNSKDGQGVATRVINPSAYENYPEKLNKLSEEITGADKVRVVKIAL